MRPLPSRAKAAGLRRLCSSIAVLLFASNVCAQDTLLDAARARLSLRDAAGAYALLSDAEVQRAGDARFDYLLGVAALDAGHITRAIFALERAVQNNPKDVLSRAELGRAYLAAGDPAAAREQWQQVRRAELPAEAAAAIDRVLSVVDQVAPPSAKKISGYVELSAGYDSNVNSATHQGEFAIPAFGGILFQNAPENRQQHDAVTSAAAGIAAEKPLSSSWQLVGTANVRAAMNREVHNMDTVFFDATGGLRHTEGAQSQLVALQNNTAWVGGSLYRTASGVTGQWQWQLAAAAQASVFGQWSRQVYKGQSERNTDRYLLGVGAARQFAGAGPLAYGSAYAVHEHARTPTFENFGHHGAGVRLGLEHTLRANVITFGEWQYEQRRYGGTEPFFDVARREIQSDLSAGVRWKTGHRWEWVAQARRARVGSNVVLYDYTRNVFQITAHRSFT